MMTIKHKISFAEGIFFFILFICNSVALSQGCGPINNNNPGNGGTHATICFFNSSGVSMGPCLDCQLTGSGWKCDNAFNAYVNYYSATIAGVRCYRPTVLPIELTSFDAVAEEKGIRLMWSTSSERGSAYFEVLRLNSAMDSQTVATIAAAGNSNTEIHYTFFDDKPENGINYYMLRQFDLNGENKVLEIVSVDAGHKDITFYPNPLTSNTIEWSDSGMAESLQIYNAAGQLVDEAELSAGSYTFERHMQSVYIFKVTYQDQTTKYFRILH